MASNAERSLDYGLLDRLVHRLVLRSRNIQLSAADIEKTLYSNDYSAVDASKPVFVSSMPRAGTTLLLELFAAHPDVATHCYRDMPLVMAPLLWSRISGRFQQRAIEKERAHGDGMSVGYDSPEAFEEIFWKLFWPSKYRKPCIELWKPDDDSEEAFRFLSDHMKKIVWLRKAGKTGGRYVSKNNGNIARLATIRSAFPDATVLVPFRHPLDHCASLLRQHLNFLDLHRAQPFSKEYMADIGHFEFGLLHRPIAFSNAVERLPTRDPETIDYWLTYWIVAFEHILEHADAVELVSYEKLCERPKEQLKLICGAAKISEQEIVEAGLRKISAPRNRQGAKSDTDPRLVEEAVDLYDRLVRASIGN